MIAFIICHRSLSLVFQLNRILSIRMNDGLEDGLMLAYQGRLFEYDDD